jgi:small-conductance mechanosensitive channel
MTGLDPSQLLGWSKALSAALLGAGLAIAIALVLHLVLFALLARLARVSPDQTDDILVARLRQPLRFSMMAVAVAIAAEHDPMLARMWAEIARFVVPALMGWTGYALVKALASALGERVERGDDEEAIRSRRTRLAILSRSAGFLIVLITVALVLFAIPGVRNVGVTLLASAGMATLVLGVAAQPVLKSLFGGIQIAITEPVRIGDFVVVDGESGRIEDIKLSYVVLRTGDERRVIVPPGRFVDHSFQNWTRQSGGITGSVVLPVRPGTSVPPIREAYLALLSARKEWDRRTGALHVTELRSGIVELTLAMSAPDPASLLRLRFAMREAMHAWLAEHRPEALCMEV